MKNASRIQEDNDAMFIEAADTIERQLAHQEQLGGSLSASEPQNRSIGNVSQDKEDNDAMLIEAAKAVKRQLAHQEQLGGGLSASEPGQFELTLNPYIDHRSHAMGVRERHYLTDVEVGQFLPQEHLAADLRDGLQRALQNLILREWIPKQDHVYFSLASNQLNNS